MVDFDSYAQSDTNVLKIRNRNQYYGAFIVNLGALSLGTVIGWSSPTETLLEERLNATDSNLAWISSLMTLGAASSQIVMALLLNFLSCKHLLISMNIGLVLSWILLACSTDVILFYVGRFFAGFFAGTNCVTVPIFMGEISHKSIRGGMGTLFQLMLVLGILIIYILGEFQNFFVMVCLPIIFPASQVIPMILLPESPVYSIKKGNVEGARKTLRYFRGPEYEIEEEVAEMIAYVTSTNEDTILEVMKQRSSLNAIIILVALHFVQQLSGIYAFTFYATEIFDNAGSYWSPGVSAIVVATVQVLVTAVATVLVDKVGRRLLLVVSLTILAASNIILGTYMLLSRYKPDVLTHVHFLPVVLLSIYIIGYSLGAGPLPWLLLGEMVPDKIKFVVNTGEVHPPDIPFSYWKQHHRYWYLCLGVACLNWILAFLVTVSFKSLKYSIGTFTVFYIYGSVCIMGMLFVFFNVVETKNKTLEAIQISLSMTKGGRSNIL